MKFEYADIQLFVPKCDPKVLTGGDMTYISKLS